MGETSRRKFYPEELTEACRYILAMRDNCIKPGKYYDDPDAMKKAKALNIALDAIDELPDWRPMEKIKIKYLNTDLGIVHASHPGEWYDLRAAETVEMKKGEFKMIPLGVCIKVPDGFESIVAPRSSTFKKYHVIQTNSFGVIDGAYCGDGDQWMLPVYAVEDTVIPFNERICQFRIQKVQPSCEIATAESMESADRGGFGSTGRI